MIRLIASDLDGTLLQNGCRTISNRMFEIIETLYHQGVLFVAASGRQYPNLYRLFGPVSKYMAFVCENGGLVVYQDQVISASPMDRTLSLKLMEDIWNRDGCEILLSGQNTSYLMPKSHEYVYLMKEYVKNNVTVVDHVSSVTEDFLKVSVFEKAGIAENSGDYFISKWQDTFKCTISGHGWLDFTAPDVNKGNALKSLMNQLSIRPSEAMAFGDNYNDLEMLSLVKYGYVMENAAEAIKNQYPYHSKKVEDTIQEVFELFH